MDGVHWVAVGRESRRWERWGCACVQAEAAEKAQAAAEAAAALHAELGRVFGRGGVQHFEMDSVVHDLSARTEPLLRVLAPQFQLQLHTLRVRSPSNPPFHPTVPDGDTYQCTPASGSRGLA